MPGHFSREETGALQLARVTMRAGGSLRCQPGVAGPRHEPAADPLLLLTPFAPDLCGALATVQLLPFKPPYLAMFGGIASVTLSRAIQGLLRKNNGTPNPVLGAGSAPLPPPLHCTGMTVARIYPGTSLPAPASTRFLPPPCRLQQQQCRLQPWQSPSQHAWFVSACIPAATLCPWLCL